jgi:hypothetical protein
MSHVKATVLPFHVTQSVPHVKKACIALMSKDNTTEGSIRNGNNKFHTFEFPNVPFIFTA